MSDTQANINTHFVGRDGFIWWIGQVAPEDTWKDNKTGKPEDSNEDIDGFAERYRVRIMGYHSCVKDIPDEALPWAYVMYPVTAGGGDRNSSQNANINQGDFVFGFFIDGEMAQTPVILAIIGNNEYNKVLKTLPQDECFIPYSGYKNDGEKISSTGVRAEGGGRVVEQVNSKGQGNNDQVNESASGDVAIKPIADPESKKSGRVEEPLAEPSECDKNPVGAIQKELQNAMTQIQDVKKRKFNEKFALVAGTAEDIASLIENICEKAAEFIAGILKFLLDLLMKKILNKTGEKAKDTYYLALNNERPQVRKKTESILDQIVCLFRKLIDALLDQAKGFVCDAADKAVTAPPCLVQGFVNGILQDAASQGRQSANQGLGELSGLLGGLGGGLGGGGMGGLGDIAGGGGLEEILSFLKCDDEIECSPVNEWSIFDGANQSQGFSMDFLGGLGGFGGNFGGGSDSGSDSDSDSGGGSGGGGFGASIGGSGCDAGPQPCGPPTVKFFGYGAGAKGNLIISELGEVMGVDMVDGGAGYTKNSFAIVQDPCGNGGGAVIDPIIDDGVIEDIIVIDPGFGYLPDPDGSKGGDGNKWSDPDDTIIIRDDVYDPPTPPGNVVEVVPGDSVELPPGTSTEIIGDDCVQTLRGGRAEIVTCGGKFTTPRPSYEKIRGNYPNLSTGSYPVVLYLCEIRVLESGVNYASTDEVVIEPNFGAKASLQLGDQGVVLSVKVTESGEGFREVPNVYIKSETGYNAVLVPKLCIDRVGDDELKQPRLQDKVVSVVDCVGKFNV